MKYRLPTTQDIDILRDYVEEHYSNYERSIIASNGLTTMDYNKWVEKINRNSKEADDDWGTYYLYLVIDDKGRLVGLLNIRYNLTDDLREKYGDVGYGVRPSERRKGYATKMLKYAISVCKKKNMKSVIVGCYDDNIGSKNVIMKNGGVLYKNDYEEKDLSENWKIKLKRNFYKINL